MARNRNYSREYQRRLSRGLERGGYTRQAARGHFSTPEHPVDALRHPTLYAGYIQRHPETMGRLADTPAGARRVAAYNQGRIRQGLPPIFVGSPPFPGPGVRQMSFDSLSEAEHHVRGIPPDTDGSGAGSGGASIYLSEIGFTAQITRGVRARRRAA